MDGQPSTRMAGKEVSCGLPEASIRQRSPQCAPLRHAEALRQFNSLGDVSVTGVERTLYPMIREHALRYLDALGYSDLTRHPGFFVIGDTTISGTRRKADGFICAPDLGEPIYALEVGFGGLDKFESDYQKSVNEWTRTGLLGIFILLFDVSNDCDPIYRLDGATLSTPRNEGFAIMPLVLPITPRVETAFESITCFQYFERHGQRLLRRGITFSDRAATDVRGWTSEFIDPLFERNRQFFVNSVLDTTRLDEQRLVDLLQKEPQLLVLQGKISPFKSFTEELRAKLESYIRSHSPAIVIFADWFRGQEWESDRTMSDLLPVEFDPQEVTGWRKAFFGRQIRPGANSFLNLVSLDAPQKYVKGFACSKVKAGREVSIDLEVEFEGVVYPFVVSEPARSIVFVASGIGGWGSPWRNDYGEGFSTLWQQILAHLPQSEPLLTPPPFSAGAPTD